MSDTLNCPICGNQKSVRDTHSRYGFICPECGKGHLIPYDHCSRISRHADSEDEWFMIPRGRCSHCKRLHRALPDFMIPYKHYDARAISDVLDEVVTPENFAGSFPTESSMKRWQMWLMINRALIDGILKSFAHRQLGFSEKLLKSEDSLLEKLRASYEHWLETIVRVIYNSGARLSPLNRAT